MADKADKRDRRPTTDPSGDITCLLISWSHGDEHALEELMPLVYDRLRRLAASFLQHERLDHTLETAALVNEAYLRLIDQSRVEWRDQAHFFAIAGQLMRRILVDHARSQKYAKRGGDAEKVSVDILERVEVQRPEELIALDEALDVLAEKSHELVKIVELRYFGGFTKEETARILDISSATVSRRMRVARAWLHHYMATGEAIEV